MTKADDIVRAIRESERYRNARSFEDRVFRDEPILRTGAEAFARPSETGSERAAARSVAVSSRPASPAPAQTKIYYDATANVEQQSTRRHSVPRGRLPRQLSRMHALARKTKTWRNNYHGGGGGKLFFEQARLMADYEDEFDGPADGVRFFPTYEDLSDYQLRSYFAWRTRYRAFERAVQEATADGDASDVAPAAPAAFVYLNACEILCGAGVECGMQGYKALKRLQLHYGQPGGIMASYLTRWLHDYAVYFDLDPALARSTGELFSYESVSVLRQAEEVLLAIPGARIWPDEGRAGLPAPEELLDALCAVSRYRADRSKFFRERRADVAQVVAHVYARMVDHCAKRRKTGLVDGFFGAAWRVGYTMFPSALFWMPDAHADTRFEVAEGNAYVCEEACWYSELPCRRSERNRELGDLLHAVDTRMRLAAQDAHPLKARKLPKYQGKFVDEEIAALIVRKEAEEAARIRINKASLGRIRSAAARTREALLTDEEREEQTETSMLRRPTSPSATAGLRAGHRPAAPTEAEPSGPVAFVSASGVVPSVTEESVQDGPVLTDDQRALLASLLSGEPVQGDALYLSLATDAINEAFLDLVGDTVLEYVDDTPTLVEDYEQEVRSALS